MAVFFVAILIHSTLGSTSTSRGHLREVDSAAASECRRAVREVVADGRFPFAANIEDLGEGRLQLSGTVDAGVGAESVRRNFECFLSHRSSSEEFRTDSVNVWQSH
ncbi:hypothetical protein BH23GEM6_BH23GEM6_24410 [soil metagenome]